MMPRAQTLAMLGMGSLLVAFGGSADEAGPRAAGGDLAPPMVRILAGARTTAADMRFFSFSCTASNSNQAPLMFVGYRADSFDPPIEDGRISPIHIIQFQHDGKWKEHPQGWCGTGMDGIVLPAGRTRKFTFAVPVDRAGKLVRVGIRWSRPLDFAVAKPESYKVAWSEPFELKQIDAGGDGKEQKKRDGTWVAVAMEQDGTKLPADMVKKLAIKLIVTGDKYKVTFAGKVVDQGTSKDDWTKKPPTIDIMPSEGPNKGKTIQAIVALDGDSLKVCYNLTGTERPSSFTTKEGSGHLLISYEREKK